MEGRATLSPRQENLLKRELLRLQISDESTALDNLVNVDLLGAPFVTPAGEHADGHDMPLLSYLFRTFIVSFPLLSSASEKFWVEVAQPFIQGLASKDISSSADRDEATKRRRLGRIAKRMILMLFVAGTSSNSPQPKTDRYSGADKNVGPQSQPVELMRGPKEANYEQPAEQKGKNARAAVGTVIGVRTPSSSTMFKSNHTEYIVEAKYMGQPPVWTLHTYQDFANLNQRLIKLFPGKPLARFPSKIKADSKVVVQGEVRELARERQRTTLRSYLLRLSSIPKVAQCEPFLEFLFKDKVPHLSDEEVDDVLARLALDKQHEVDSKRFYELAAEREKKLTASLGEIKSEILLEDALPRLFLELRAHDKVEDMSPLLQKFVEWCLIEVASAIYHILISRDDSPELFGQMKRLHQLMPYKVMQGILMMSNPALIMKKLTDLFMATPFGGKSLLQQMFIRVLNDDIRSQDALLDELEPLIGNEEIIRVLQKYAWTDHYTREAVNDYATASGIDLVLAILESSVPPVSPEILSTITYWHSKWQEAVQGLCPEDLPEVERYSQLKDFLKLTVRKRDKDIMKDFWAEPLTIKFIREALDLFYNVLIEIFRTTRMSESVGDLERFVSDIIAFVEYADGGIAMDPNQMVERLIELCRAHQNSVFKFIHRVYSQDSGFFIELVDWLSLFVNFIRAGKRGDNKLDLLGLVKTQAARGVIDVTKLQHELDVLDQWLVRRKRTADPRLVVALPAAAETESSLENGEQQQSNFSITDIGLTWEDIDFGLAEAEVDDQEGFVPELTVDMAEDAVARERKRRERWEEVQKRLAQMSERPNSREIAKMLGAFSQMLNETLSRSHIEPTRLQDFKLEDVQ